MYRDYLCAYTSPSDVHFIHYDINTLLYFHTAVAPFTSFPSRLVSTSAIRQSILNENSCNPVVKAAATSILSIATRQSPSRVENVRKRLAWLHMYNNYILKNCSALHTPKKTNEVKLLHVCVCVCACVEEGGVGYSNFMFIDTTDWIWFTYMCWSLGYGFSFTQSILTRHRLHYWLMYYCFCCQFLWTSILL